MPHSSSNRVSISVHSWLTSGNVGGLCRWNEVRPSSLAVIGLGAIGGSLAWQARLAGVAAGDRLFARAVRRHRGPQGLRDHRPGGHPGPRRAGRRAGGAGGTPAGDARSDGPAGAGTGRRGAAHRCLQRQGAGTGSRPGRRASPIASPVLTRWPAPMRVGFSSARPDRLRGCVVYICETETPAGHRAADGIASFWEHTLEASPIRISAESHDRQLAWTSHLPQAVAYALARSLARHGQAGVSYGSGARDTTRLAGSNPDMWVDILLYNEPAVARGARAHGSAAWGAETAARQPAMRPDSAPTSRKRKPSARASTGEGRGKRSGAGRQEHYPPGAPACGIDSRNQPDRRGTHLAGCAVERAGTSPARRRAVAAAPRCRLSRCEAGSASGAPEGPLFCGNSGTTTRLLLGLLSAHRFSATLTGDRSLRRRPMRRVTVPLSADGRPFHGTERRWLAADRSRRTRCNRCATTCPSPARRSRARFSLPGWRERWKWLCESRMAAPGTTPSACSRRLDIGVIGGGWLDPPSGRRASRAVRDPGARRSVLRRISGRRRGHGPRG